MPVVPVGHGHFTLTMRHVATSRAMQITCGGVVDALPFTQANNDELAGDWGAALQPLYDSAWSFTGMVGIVTNTLGTPSRFESTILGTGSRSSVESPPPNVAYLVRKSTGLIGRKNRGRQYLPASAESGITEGGALTTAEAALLQAYADQLFENVFAPPGASNIASIAILHDDETVVPTIVTALVAQQSVATQRRRLVRV